MMMATLFSGGGSLRQVLFTLSAIFLFPIFARAESKPSPIQVDGLNFTLSSTVVSYQFHVGDDGDLIHDYFGAFNADPIRDLTEPGNGWRSLPAQHRREFPDQGRGDFRLPAFHIRHDSGSTVSQFVYEGYDIVEGKPALDGLPATWGNATEVSTLQIYLVDQQSSLTATLLYSIFPEIGAITRSFKLKNEGETDVVLERAMSWSLDFPPDEWEMVQLSGDWASEGRAMRRPVYTGIQGFQSSAGYSSHFHNPFLALVHPDTTETMGSAYGFNLIYTGSHTTEVEKFTPGFTRVLMGLNPLHLSWKLSPEETFVTPECVAVYSEEGLGGMSRAFHRLYREHLIRSKWVDQTRPVLINSWEAFGFDFTDTGLQDLAKTAVDLGVELFVLDDGWFGNTYPRTSDEQGLGDWEYNTERFPQGLGLFVDNITSLTTSNDKAMKFGIWVEPEMVNPRSSLYNAHPEWVLSSSNYTRTETRNQLVLDVGRPEVQNYIIDFMTDLLSNASISYVKWDNNRGMHELPHPSSAHSYILGLYHVIDTLTSRFPDILWEGCASGGGRFDPGLMYYWPQTWTSDDTDAYERLFIQFGTSIPYPPSTQGAHVSSVPNGQLERTTPLEFRAHVAMMGGSFGFEMDLGNMTEGEKGQVKELIEVAEKVNPLIISGDMYKLALPEASNWPAALYVSKDKSEAVLLAYQVRSTIMTVIPALKLQGLEEESTYHVNGTRYQGSSLMNAGLKLGWEKGDYLSKVLWITKE